MTTEPASIAKPQPARPRSELRFPVYDLADSVAAAKAVHEKGGGVATNDHLAAFLGYKSAKNGAFVNRVASAKLFGLIEGPPSRIVITSRAQKILMPINAGDPKQALIDAFLSVPLYAAIYREYQSKELPPEFGMKNALRTMFGVTPGRVDEAYRAFFSSADAAGFFEVRGSKTQLIMPMVPAGIPRTLPLVESSAEDGTETEGGNGGGGGGFTPPPSPPTSEDLRNQYVSALIGLLRERGTQGDIDTELMERIEKLLGVSSQ
jgi:hypothetical protein